MDLNIKKIDAYYKLARSKPLTLQEANTKLKCNFVLGSTDLIQAYKEYKQHYKTIILEENCAPGEPIQQRVLSFRHFLKKQNLVKKTEQRRMFIGTHGKTQAAKDISALRRLALDELKQDEKELHSAATLNLKSIKSFKSLEKQNLEKEQNISKEKIEKANSEINSSTFLKYLKNITKELSTEEKKVWNNSLYFVPKNEALQDVKEKDVETIILNHAFENKNDIVEKLNQWKLAFNDPTKQGLAKEMTIRNRNNHDIKVGNIAYSLQSCQNLIKKVKESNKSMQSAYFLPLVNKKLI